MVFHQFYLILTSWRSSEIALKRCLKTALDASHFFDDVSGETAISEDSEIRTSISTSRCFEDVSGETIIFSRRRLKMRPPTSRFGEDVSGETLILGIRRVLDNECAPHVPPPGPPPVDKIPLGKQTSIARLFES